MSDTDGVPLFAVFPYLKTSQPITVRGLQLRGSSDLDGLPSDAREQLTSLLSLFFLRDNLRIVQMTYAYLPATSDWERAYDFIERVGVAQTLIAYLYTAPHTGIGGTVLSFDHASVYLLHQERVYESRAESESGLVEDVSADTANTANMPDKPSAGGGALRPYLAGFTGTLNQSTYVSVAAGMRIYPPPPHFWLNLAQDLYHDLDRYLSERRFWALHELLWSSCAKLTDLEERVLTALDWYNRGTALGVSESVALLYLAVAFESLFKLERSEQSSQRFKETILTLLGPIPQLDSWLDQFYELAPVLWRQRRDRVYTPRRRRGQEPCPKSKRSRTSTTPTSASTPVSSSWKPCA